MNSNNSVTYTLKHKQLGLFDQEVQPTEQHRVIKPSQTINHPTELPLRDYQQKSVEQVLDLFTQVQRVLVQQPTGAGKSLIIAALVKEFVSRGEPVLLVAHKVELIRQLRDHVKKWIGIEPGIIANKQQFKRNPEALIQVGSIQALSRFRELPRAGLVVIDEAHHSHARTYSKLFSWYKESYFLGVTATPLRLDGRGLRFLYNGVPGYEALVEGVSVRELIETGYLCDFKLFAASNVLDPAAAGIRTRAGDWVQDELAEYAEGCLLYGDVVETWETHAKGRRTVVYPVSVKYSQELCQEFKDKGYPAEHLDADTPAKEREGILERFRSGETLILCQHSIIIEGVDVPSIGAVVFARPTKSLTIWFQAIGRALRPAEGKEHCILIDHTTTHQNLPLPDFELEWSLDPISLPKGEKGVIQCPKCNHVYRLTEDEKITQLSTCPSCQTRFTFEYKRDPEGSGLSPKPVEIVPADFNQVNLQQPNQIVQEKIDVLFKEQSDRGYKKSWVFYRLKDEVLSGKLPLNLWDLKALAVKLGYKPGWAYYKFKEIQSELTANQ